MLFCVEMIGIARYGHCWNKREYFSVSYGFGFEPLLFNTTLYTVYIIMIMMTHICTVPHCLFSPQ